MEPNFENTMENLKTPNTEFVKHQDVLKIGMMNARKSARIGIVFILLPVVIAFLAYIKIWLLTEFGFFEKLNLFLAKNESISYTEWGVHLLVIIMPLIAIVVNLMAICHFYINKTSKELIITIKYQLKNIIVLIVAVLFVLAMLFTINVL